MVSSILKVKDKRLDKRKTHETLENFRVFSHEDAQDVLTKR